MPSHFVNGYGAALAATGSFTQARHTVITAIT